MTISLPDDLKDFVERRIKAGSFASASEFIRQLLREDQKRAERERLDQMLLDGMNSGKPIRANDAYWDDLRSRVERRAAEGKSPSRRR
jgi:antitoxin ParD1/3/4